MQQKMHLQRNIQAGRVPVVAAPVLVKKYGNRRLYDTGDSKYVTLDELATKIRTGADIRVVDANTNEDLTQATLTQLVLETGHAARFLPVQLLLQMIRLSDDSLAEFFSRYVTGALDLYLQAKRGVQSLASYNPLTQIPVAATDALTRMWMGGPFGGGGYPQQYGGYPPPQHQPQHNASFTPAPPPPDDEPPPDGNGDRSDVAAMRRELDELKQAIRDGFAAKAPPSKPAARKKKPT
jgi:polyhydroxyalkanoate synthesis repressor PhaR